jgi:hypothetical protein
MIEDWIPFHRRLVRGKKRSLSRAVRFVYLELALEARATEGTIELPLDWGTLDAVHDLLGGTRSEIKNALEAFTKIDDTGVSPLKIVRNATEHTLIVTKWGEWAGPKTSTQRVREYRERKKNESLPTDETLHDVSPRNVGNVGEEKTGEEKRREEKKRNGSALHLPGLTELETEIRRWPVFAALDAHAIAKAQAERILTGPQQPAWLVVAVAECAEKTPATLGLTPEALTHKLVGFMRNAKRPKVSPRVVVESEPEREPSEAELVANRKRLEEREAKAKAERERRAALGQSLEGPKR